MPDAQKETKSTQDTKGKQKEKEDMKTISDNKHRDNGEIFIRTRYGRIVKNQTGSCMNATTKTFALPICQTLCKS